MGWTVRQYGLPVLMALALHAALGVWLKGMWQPSETESSIFKPKIVNSTLLVLEPKATPKPPPKATPKPQPQATTAKPAPAKTEPAPPEPAVEKAPEPDPEIEAARERARLEAAKEEEARLQRLQALADTSFMNSLEDEAVDLAEAASANEEAVAQSYRFGIYQKIVANWSRPPSARNGMQARLQVELVPTGDVVAVMLLESSGSRAFDQSAESAVKKARRFEVPKESAIFEPYFRRFTLLFKPEDLLR